MTGEVEHLLDALLRLRREDRACVAAILIDSLEHGSADEIDTAWSEEALCRLERVRSGRTTPSPTEVVEQELDGIVARAYATERTTG